MAPSYTDPMQTLDQALAQALWRLQSKNITKECSSETDTSKSDDPHQYLNVLEDLNTLACSHITSYLSKHNKQNFEIVDLDIEVSVSLLHSLVMFLLRNLHNA